MKRYDVIISGGGMVGAVAAVAAARSGLSVLLFEANDRMVLSSDSKRDLRVSAISWHNICFFKKLGIYDYLYTKRVNYYTGMNVWDNRTKGISKSNVDFNTDFSRQPALGCMMENNNLVHAAWSCLDALSNCDVMDNTRIHNIENDGVQIRVSLDTGEVFKSRLLIAAEGRNSFVRQKASIQTTEFDYQQKGLVCYVKIKGLSSQMASQAFNAGGPIGILPFGDDVFSIVWSLPNDKVAHWQNCSKNDFEQGVMQAIGEKARGVELISQRAAFPLTRSDASRYFSKRIVLCGDSAHGIHPLAGQGVNLGMGDVELLFQLLDKDVLKDDELLNVVLKKYQRKRISKVSETSTMMSFLNFMFVDDEMFKKPLRSLGMNIFNRLPLKKWFINQAGS